MAPLPPDGTDRFYLDYECGDREHTLLCRFTGGASPASFGTFMDTFLTGIEGLLYTVTVLGVRFGATGSGVTLPVVSGIEGNTYGASSPVPQGVPNYLRFQGRSAGGRKCSFDVFTINLSDANFRITSAENGAIGTAVGQLNAATNLFVGIDGDGVTWKPYVNVKASSYWTRAIRNGGNTCRRS